MNINIELSNFETLTNDTCATIICHNDALGTSLTWDCLQLSFLIKSGPWWNENFWEGFGYYLQIR